MGLFQRNVELYPGLSTRDLGRALHKDTRRVSASLGQLLAPGETLTTYFVCPADEQRSERKFAISNRQIWYINEDQTVFGFPFEHLVGIRMRAGYVRFGFRGPDDGDVTLLTEFIGGGPHESVAMWTCIAKEWKQHMGREFPKDAFRDAVPELQMVGDPEPRPSTARTPSKRRRRS